MIDTQNGKLVAVVVDDEEFCRKNTGHLLQHIFNFKVLLASRAGLASEYLSHQARVDLLVSDINLGKDHRSGLDLIRMIRDPEKSCYHPELKIVLVSGEDLLAETAKQWRVNGFCQKPLSRPVFEKTIQEVLNAKLPLAL